MNRTKVIVTLFSCYCLTGCLALVWGAKAWASTNPAIRVPQNTVKGVSTESTPLVPFLQQETGPALSPYPELSPEDFPTIHAKEYALYNPESGKVLVQSSSETPVPIASTTKLMTTHLIAKIGTMDDVVTISETAVDLPADSSLMGLRAGDQLTVEDLLYGALLVSGNDAAAALAEYGGGLLLDNPDASSAEKIARFVEEMNSEAKRLHLQDTLYFDPIGYNDQGRSTALDVAKLLSIDLTEEQLTTIMGTAQKTVVDQTGTTKYNLRNSNRLVTDYSYTGILGGKTGYTYEAGHCLATAARRNGITLVAVILHTDQDTPTASAIENRKLLDAGFNLVHWN